MLISKGLWGRFWSVNEVFRTIPKFISLFPSISIRPFIMPFLMPPPISPPFLPHFSSLLPFHIKTQPHRTEKEKWKLHLCGWRYQVQIEKIRRRVRREKIFVTWSHGGSMAKKGIMCRRGLAEGTLFTPTVGWTEFSWCTIGQPIFWCLGHGQRCPHWPCSPAARVPAFPGGTPSAYTTFSWRQTVSIISTLQWEKNHFKRL